MATTKLRVATTDPGDGGGGKPTAQQLAAATMFAKQFAARKGLISAQDMHVGNQLPPVVDEAGRVLPANAPQPKPNVKIETYVPPEINELQWDAQKNLPFYIHPQTGDPVYVPQDYFHLPRFNPNRGKPAVSETNIMAYAKK